MNPVGLKEVRRITDRGLLIVNYVGDAGDLRDALLALIRQLPLNSELSAIEVGPAECFHEVRSIAAGLELKRGCHGAHGTWRTCTQSEAVEWLLPGLEAVTSNPRLGSLALSMCAGGQPFAAGATALTGSGLSSNVSRGIVMTSDKPKEWGEEGCADCRQAVLVGLPAPLLRLGHIGGGHFLHRCEKCGAYWQETLRLAHVISGAEAQALLVAIGR